MKKLTALALAVLPFALPLAVRAADATPPARQLMSKLAWRNIGPYIGGRVVAIAADPSQPNVFYFGGVEGGIWKSTDYGLEWTNISDGKLPLVADSIGALAIAPSNTSVIYAGTGESDIRNDFYTGAGIFKSTDAGETWHYAGLSDTHTTSALAVDPKNPNVVYASSLGHVFKSNSERGVFKTTDGGKTWKKILFVDDNTGAGDLVMDPHDSRTLYAAMWQAQRVPWKLTSGGPGSGLYKTTDGGAHWTKISSNPGFATGLLGHMGVSVSATNPRSVYAIVQAKDGGVFRSMDGGKTWKRVNDEMKLRQRAFYYMAIFADPTNQNVAYVPEVDGVFKTTDGGRTWRTITSQGDHHIIWVNPRNPKILLEGNDGGAMVSTDGGDSWSSENNQPTGQFYHIALDDQFPFHVYGAQQDEGAYEGPSAVPGGGIPLGDWHEVAAGESTFVAPQPGSPNVTYGSGYYSTMLRWDNSTGQTQNVSPWAKYMSGASAVELKERFGWTHPVMFSPANPSELFAVSQHVFSSTDEGKTWKVLSPDLTRDDKSTEGPSGGPIDYDQTSAETFPDIASLAVSPLNGDVIWAGSADGLVHVTRDHGANWTLVTPPQLPQWAQISSIDASHFAPGTAYLSANRYQWDDFHPYIYKTTDYGATWTAITNGLPGDHYVHVVRESPREPRLLFAGTRATVYVSLDGGANWQPLTLNLPGVQVRDLAINARQGQVAIATHGRSFWILDDLALLEALARDPAPSVATVQLFPPETAWLTHAYGGDAGDNEGENPAYGATVFFNVPASYVGKTPLTLSFQDASGATIRTFDLHIKDKHEKKVDDDLVQWEDAIHEHARELQDLTAVQPGMNRFQWDLRYPPVTDIPGVTIETTDDFPNTVKGPTIVPGAYAVVLQYGTQKISQPLTVKLDPRLHATQADLDARLALGREIAVTLDGFDRVVNAALAARATASPAKRAQIDAALESLVQLDISSSEGDVLKETKLRDHIAFLAGEIELAYEKPTAAQYQVYDELKADAAAGEARLQSVLGAP